MIMEKLSSIFICDFHEKNKFRGEREAKSSNEVKNDFLFPSDPPLINFGRES